MAQYDPAVIQAIVKQARAAGVDPALMVAVAMEESGLRPGAVGDQGTSFGLYQLHRGGALGNLTPQQASDPNTNAGLIARAIKAAGGQGWHADASGLTNYYRQIGRGSSVSGPTNKALSMVPQVQSLLGQAGAPVPPVGGQAQQQTSAAGAQPFSLSPQLMKALLASSTQGAAQAAAGTYKGGFADTPLFKQLLAAHQQQAEVPQVRGATSPGGAPRFTGAIPGAMAGTDYPLGTRGPLIGTPYQGTHTLGNWESDRAVDIRTPVGTPVVAASDGVIGSQIGALGSSNPRMAGLRVHVDGPTDNFYYAHLSALAPGIKPGAHVRAGEVIGYSGSANGTPHLHFASQNRDPRSYTGGL